MRLLTSFLLLVLTLTTHAIKAPTSYCKCICFQNSTIIPLNSPPDTSSSSPQNLHLRDEDSTSTTTDTNGGKKHHTLTCNDCNRAFCLDYNLPICKNAKEEDVFATCFRMSLPLQITSIPTNRLHRTRLPERPHDSNHFPPRDIRTPTVGTTETIYCDTVNGGVGTEIWGSNRD